MMHDVHFQIVGSAINGMLRWRMEIELVGREQTLRSVGKVDLELTVRYVR